MAKKKERKVPEVLVFTDTNRHIDDLASLAILAYLNDKRLINLRGIITQVGTFETRRRRAMFAKGAMSYLGYPFVKAVPGGDYETLEGDENSTYVETPFTPVFEAAGTTVQRSGTLFLQEYIKTIKEKNIILVFDAPFADFGKYMKATHDTIAKKVKRIIISGDVLENKDEEGFYQADLDSPHFKYCKEAAQDLIKYVQEKEIRTTIVPTKTNDAFEMDYACFADFRKSKNPVFQQLLSLKDEKDKSKFAHNILTVLCLVEGIFKAGGGEVEKEDDSKGNVSFARLNDAQMMRDKLAEIFKEKLEPKVISMDHLSRKKPEAEENQSASEDAKSEEK